MYRVSGLEARLSTSQSVVWQQRRMWSRFGVEGSAQRDGGAQSDDDPDHGYMASPEQWQEVAHQLKLHHGIASGGLHQRPLESEETDPTTQQGKSAEEYFGFEESDRRTPFTLTHDAEGNEVKIYHNPPPALTRDQIYEKYLAVAAGKENLKKEQLVQTSYGMMRIDVDNDPRVRARRLKRRQEKLQRALKRQQEEEQQEPCAESTHNGLQHEPRGQQLTSEKTSATKNPRPLSSVADQPAEEASFRAQPAEEAQFRAQPAEEAQFKAQPAEEAQFKAQPAKEAQFKAQPAKEAQFKAQPAKEAQFRAQPAQGAQFFEDEYFQDLHAKDADSETADVSRGPSEGPSPGSGAEFIESQYFPHHASARPADPLPDLAKKYSQSTHSFAESSQSFGRGGYVSQAADQSRVEEQDHLYERPEPETSADPTRVRVRRATDSDVTSRFPKHQPEAELKDFTAEWHSLDAKFKSEKPEPDPPFLTDEDVSRPGAAALEPRAARAPPDVHVESPWRPSDVRPGASGAPERHEARLSVEQFESAPAVPRFESLYPEEGQGTRPPGQRVRDARPDVFGKLAREDDVYEQPERPRRAQDRPEPNLDRPQTALDYALKLRAEKAAQRRGAAAAGAEEDGQERRAAHPRLAEWKGKVDSRGYRVLKDQVRNLEWETRDAVADMLRASVIFENEDLVALDKPYGLPSHGGPGVHHSVGALLPDLARRLQGQRDPLHLIHRLDKETTGVMLLARNADVAWRVHGMFRRREVSKTYWALTKGIPTPGAGVIDIPMAEGEVKGRFRMTLRPLGTEETRQLDVDTGCFGSRLEAVTEYKILSVAGKAALVQLTPSTGVKHQIRVHLAFGLNTPILGDHKYSHYGDMKPQKLHPEILNRLKIQQSKVRYLPMHLHARELVLPEIYEGRNTIIRARLPKFFVQNMKWLKMAVPK